MGDLSLIVLTTDSKDGAAQALNVAKGLDRDGWIELMDYGIVSKDEKGRVTVRDLGDEYSEKVVAASAAVGAGVLGGVVGGPVGAVAGVAAGALAGAGSMRLMEKFVQDTSLEEFPASLGANNSVLAVIVEERYAERLDEELQKLGRIARRELKWAEREAEFEVYLKMSKDKLRSIQNEIHALLAKAETARGAEKTKIEADLAAKRAELEAKREKIEDHIKAMNSNLRSEIREMNFRLELAGITARAGIASGIDHLHRQLNHFNDELENLIQDQIEMLEKQTAELKAKVATATGETKVAIENHLLAVEFRLRREHAKLKDSFEGRLLQMKQWFENLHVRSVLAQAELRDKLQASVKAAQHTLAELRARVHMRNLEDERAWKDIRQGFNKAWKDLEESFDQANHERV